MRDWKDIIHEQYKNNPLPEFFTNNNLTNMRYTQEQLKQIKHLEDWQDLAHRTKDAYLIEQADRWLRDYKFECREAWNTKAE